MSPSLPAPHLFHKVAYKVLEVLRARNRQPWSELLVLHFYRDLDRRRDVHCQQKTQEPLKAEGQQGPPQVPSLRAEDEALGGICLLVPLPQPLPYPAPVERVAVGSPFEKHHQRPRLRPAQASRRQWGLLSGRGLRRSRAVGRPGVGVGEGLAKTLAEDQLVQNAWTQP